MQETENYVERRKKKTLINSFRDTRENREKEGWDGVFLFVCLVYFLGHPENKKWALEMKNRIGEKKNSIENFEDKIEGIS